MYAFGIFLKIQIDKSTLRVMDDSSYNTVIKVKVVKIVCTTEHIDLFSYFYSCHTSQFGSEVHEHFNNI